MVEREFSLNYAVSIHIKFFVWGAAIKHPVMVASLAGSNQMGLSGSSRLCKKPGNSCA
jgi:hypothetical protein